MKLITKAHTESPMVSIDSLLYTIVELGLSGTVVELKAFAVNKKLQKKNNASK